MKNDNKKKNKKTVSKKIPILTRNERNEILEKYHLKAKDIRLLEKVGINESQRVMNDIRKMFPKHRVMRFHVFTDDYVEWHEKYSDEYYLNKKAPAATDANEKNS